MAKKVKQEGLVVEQLKDGRWALKHDGEIVIEAQRKATVESILKARQTQMDTLNDIIISFQNRG